MKSMFGSIMCVIVGLSLMVGCASNKVFYGEVQSADYEGKIKFNLAKSLIKLDVAKCGKDQGNCPKNTEAVSVPAEFGTVTYTITAQDNLFFKTHLKVTYFDNTRLISSIGSELEDNRIKIIQAVGAGLGAATSLVKQIITLETETPKLPVVIDIDDYKEKADCKNGKLCRWIDLPSNETDWCYRIDFGDISQDGIKAQEFFKQYSGKKIDVMIYSACRDATLWVSKKKDKEKACAIMEQTEQKKFQPQSEFVARLKVADPEYLQTMKFPDKGKIDMHSSCGANVTSEKTESTDIVSLISEILKQAKSIKEAQDKSKDTSKKQ